MVRKTVLLILILFFGFFAIVGSGGGSSPDPVKIITPDPDPEPTAPVPTVTDIDIFSIDYDRYTGSPYLYENVQFIFTFDNPGYNIDRFVWTLWNPGGDSKSWTVYADSETNKYNPVSYYAEPGYFSICGTWRVAAYAFNTNGDKSNTRAYDFEVQCASIRSSYHIPGRTGTGEVTVDYFLSEVSGNWN